MDAWERLAEVFAAWYAEIEKEVKESGVLHGDETGWRVNGRTLVLLDEAGDVLSDRPVARLAGSVEVLHVCVRRRAGDGLLGGVLLELGSATGAGGRLFDAPQIPLLAGIDDTRRQARPPCARRFFA